MHLQYSTTTVVLTYDATEQSFKYAEGNTEQFKTVTGKTIAVYETASQKRIWLLNIVTTVAKRDALYDLWKAVNGPEKTLTFRDKDGNDHSVKWLDEAFSILRQNFVIEAGTITLEEI